MRIQGGSALLRALLARAGVLVAVLLGAVVLVVSLVHLAPGDALDAQGIPEALRPALEARWHLDLPVWQRVAIHLGEVLSGDLGTSLAYRPGTPVAEVILGPARRSAVWLFSALALTLTWGTALALYTAGRASAHRVALRTVSILPVFLLAHLSVNALNEGAFAAMNAGWIDRPDWFALPDQASALRTALAVVLLAVGSGGLTEVHAAMERAVTSARRSPWAEAALARGEPLAPHLWRHLLLALTDLSLHRVAFLIGGLVILEKVLLLHGVGFILWDAALHRDSPVVAGITLLAAAVLAVVRLAGDALRLTLDPRLRSDP
ncbi:MAG: ABC transporter permease subunit [Deltaproteobacteria bacterium]|nr:ABC transporter permease subunit [Deltaproteobacteria bacterium]